MCKRNKGPTRFSPLNLTLNSLVKHQQGTKLSACLRAPRPMLCFEMCACRLARARPGPEGRLAVIFSDRRVTAVRSTAENSNRAYRSSRISR